MTQGERDRLMEKLAMITGWSRTRRGWWKHNSAPPGRHLVYPSLPEFDNNWRLFCWLERAVRYDGCPITIRLDVSTAIMKCLRDGVLVDIDSRNNMDRDALLLVACRMIADKCDGKKS
jgi:hypothetical protein